MPESDRKTVSTTMDFDCRTGVIWDAWMQPETAQKWLFATDKAKISEIVIDPTVGGKFRIVRDEGEKIEHVGHYKVLDRPRHIIFTFAVPKYSAEITTVAVHIAAIDGGKSRVSLRHEGVLPEWTEKTEQGWNVLLGNLKKLLS